MLVPGGSERSRDKQMSTSGDGELVLLCSDDTHATGTMSSLATAATRRCKYCKAQ